ncbi:N-acyl-D-amino-acid deacylase family protein [Sphingorhabdus sp. 109]|uniref:N-acyl-D-amino-acid deacylase family protein n=1 Tax=Sphingorhabdus sp. 109 TaxID=2653173 RepID=UPI0013592E47|nr:amidohydrolase family protein [Sphingorhabdus sp. 109]
MLDTLIKGGTIVDGLGGAPRIGDIGIKDGLIVELGDAIVADAKAVLNAAGAIVTPGFVDIHTHYDGQISWDDEMNPSASHGVTSVVMGNCGVGFAPVSPGGERDLIEVMEGVEDIPGTALYEGIEWGAWETFPEYLDYIDSRKYALNIGTQIPHAAVRNYVMGERGRTNEPATADDIAKMRDIVAGGLKAGALGFSSSRTIGHRSTKGVSIPGTFAAEEEVIALTDAMKSLDKGVFELIPAGVIGDLEQFGGEQRSTEEELDLMTRISKATGRPVTFTLLQHAEAQEEWRRILDQVSTANQNGANLHPQVASRPIGLVTNLKTYHLFQRRETFLRLAELPFDEMLTEMKKPDVRAAILSDRNIKPELPGTMENVHEVFKIAGAVLFEIEDPIDYEPTPDKSFAERAKRANQDYEEYMYDFLIQDDGSRFAIMLSSNFCSYNHDAIYEMLSHPETVTGLSDAGAHVTLIFDGVAPTYQMTHWSRDRTRGQRIPLEFIVQKQSYKNAQLYGLHDRGSLEVGKCADINVIDFEELQLLGLEVHADLPAGGKRILQPAKGYIATFVNGVKTRENDRDTGARPGQLLRG